MSWDMWVSPKITSGITSIHLGILIAAITKVLMEEQGIHVWRRLLGGTLSHARVELRAGDKSTGYSHRWGEDATSLLIVCSRLSYVMMFTSKLRMWCQWVGRSVFCSSVLLLLRVHDCFNMIFYSLFFRLCASLMSRISSHYVVGCDWYCLDINIFPLSRKKIWPILFYVQWHWNC
jgi:hypothetical protein